MLKNKKEKKSIQTQRLINSQKKVLEDIGRKHGTDTLIILPSSIHEVLVVPYKEGMDMNDMRAMVSEVNATEVLPEDQLISDAYKVTVTI